MRRGAPLLLVLALVLGACGTGGSPAASGRRPGAATSSTTSRPKGASVGQPCGRQVSAPSYQHVMWVFMENKDYGSVIGSSSAPYVNSLAASCGLAIDYRFVGSPSLPNYLAATGGSTFGVADDDPPSSHHINRPSIFSQVAGAGLTWRAYDESMPAPCQRSDEGLYAVRHNPAVYYVGLGSSCAANDIPMGAINGGTLWKDLQGNDFANFSFVTPNVCDDMHDCPVQQGDAWLSRFLPMVFASPTYQAGHLAVFVVWDESQGADRVPALVAAPSVPSGIEPATAFTHYSLLRTTEDLLGLAPLGQAARATSMVGPFGL